MIDYSAPSSTTSLAGEQIRIRGTVQGVGFRPLVWRLAKEIGIKGRVFNDGEGVVIQAWAGQRAIDVLIQRLLMEKPLLANIEAIERTKLNSTNHPDDFQIVVSQSEAVLTGIAPDAATCPACLEEVFDPHNRHFHYPFTNCTQCGPRLSIIKAIPYDRANTSMAAFTLCPSCQQEYDNPADRRYHAQPNACPECGPRVWLEKPEKVISSNHYEAIELARTLLRQGEIVAIKGIGGYHLACDATNPVAISRLRRHKHRDAKPFALMARDLDVIRRYCLVSEAEAQLLTSPAAPIVLLEARPGLLPDTIAPGQTTLGFMLPYSPLHHLLLKPLDSPIVLTSGNMSNEPQCINNDEATTRLKTIASHFLHHNREIINRVDDSVVRVMDGEPRVLRRARGYAPTSLTLPEGFEPCPDLLAMGSELKNTFCVVKKGQAILSQHIGDLENAATLADYQRQLALYQQLYQHHPVQIIVDAHPEYLSSKVGEQLAQSEDIPLRKVQHHHAHIAACLAEHQVPLSAKPVLGIVLDGLGYGEDNTLWGGEFLLADYCNARRLGIFKPFPLMGGIQAIRQPWRNTYAHLLAGMDWAAYVSKYRDLELTRYLLTKPLATYQTVLDTPAYSPLTSSCGRWFDAVAAALGICRENISYEGQAAMELEAITDRKVLWEEADTHAYPFAILTPPDTLPHIDPHPMWRQLLQDLKSNLPAPVIAARFHKGLAMAIVTMVETLAGHHPSLSGLRDLFIPGRVVCFEKRREYFLAAQSCCARKSSPNIPVWALARLRKSTGLLVRLAPVGSTPASLPARLSNQTTRPFNQSFTCLDDVVQPSLFEKVVLSGGVFQNKHLLEQVVARLKQAHYKVFTHRQIPANDGGIALGQAVIGAARNLSGAEDKTCV